MVGWKMDGPARDRVLKLMEEKDRLESEIRDQTAILESNHIGMQESLVDEHGYPRSDIDVYKVRHARHQIICLQNDHKNLMKMIERGLAEVHADLLGSNGGQPAHPTTSNAHTNGHVGNGHTTNGHVANGHGNGLNSYGDSPEKEPFAIVNFVDEESPAELDGLRANDEILQFGSINYDNFEDMSQIYNIVTHSVGQPIHVQVKRGSAAVSINLVPRAWAEPGLLGCHITRMR